MIIGTCPYDGCEGNVLLPIAEAEKCPCYERHECEECKRVIWTKHSRWDPCSWTEEGFLEEFSIDEVTKKIEPKNPPKPLTAKEELFQALVDKIYAEEFKKMMINGVGITRIPYRKNPLLSTQPTNDE